MQTYGLLYLAGLLVLASPCVFPILPLVVAQSARSDRRGPWALVAGFGVAFASILALLAYFEAKVFIDPEIFRRTGAAIMIVAGAFMAIEPLGRWLSQGLAGLQRRLPAGETRGLATQAIQGLLLGLVWAPCIGPTLGASLGLLGATGTRIEGAAHLAVFTAGAATPLLLLAFGSRRFFAPWIRKHAPAVRTVYGVVALLMIALGVAVLLRWDKSAESWITQRLPEWWTDLLARY